MASSLRRNPKKAILRTTRRAGAPPPMEAFTRDRFEEITPFGRCYAWCGSSLPARDAIRAGHIAKPAPGADLRSFDERIVPAVDVGQLPRGAPRRHATRCRRRRGLLSLGVAQRSEEHRFAAPRLPVGAGGG